MFTGIVETTGEITFKENSDACVELIIKPHLAFDDIAIGDSIAVNGVCLTVTKLTELQFSVTAVPETLAKTNIGLLKLGSLVNLERSMKLNSRIGGHYVQGHIDFSATILSVESDGGKAIIVTMNYLKEYGCYLVNKGYITLDGMSITLIEVDDDKFSVTFIPHTQDITIVSQYRVGTQVNVEVDIMGKYVEKILKARLA
jgi:riboflavin synthase